MAAEPDRQPHLRPLPEPTPEGDEDFLRVVDTRTGEWRPLSDVKAEVTQAMQDQLDGAEKEIAGWRTRYGNLKRDKEKEARQHELFPTAMEVFALWRKLCRHPKSSFSAERFEQVRPFLERHGRELVERAIRGAAHEAYETRRKNGSIKRHDGWELIFRNDDKFEEFANRAPRGGDNDGAAHGGTRPSEPTPGGAGAATA